MEYSMQLHGTLVPPDEYNLVPWNSMEYSMEFHGTLVPQNAISLSVMEFHGTLRLSFYSIPCYPGLARHIPWNSMELWSHQIKKSPNSMGFHGIRLAPFQMTQVWHGIPWNIPWNSMELSSISFGGTRVPWKSMEYSLEFHRTKWHFIWRHQSSMEFHGIFHGIPWN